MTDEAISPLRQRMIEDMTIRKLAPSTQEGYIRTIKMATFLGRSPVSATVEDIRRFQLCLAQRGAQTSVLNHTVRNFRCWAWSMPPAVQSDHHSVASKLR